MEEEEESYCTFIAFDVILSSEYSDKHFVSKVTRQTLFPYKDENIEEVAMCMTLNFWLW
jgi:hypothetical protein